jgi:hypothetical protein
MLEPAKEACLGRRCRRGLVPREGAARGGGEALLEVGGRELAMMTRNNESAASGSVR